MVTIGVTKAGSAWKVVSASSSLNGDRTLDGKARLRDGQAWQAAAASVGRVKSLAHIARLRGKAALGQGWKGLRVAGLGDVQQARQVAFPTVSHGYIPAYETLVLDTQAAEPTAYRVFVDARSGTVLARESLVDSEGDTAAAAPPTDADQRRRCPREDGGCDTQKGPYTVAADRRRARDRRLRQRRQRRQRHRPQALQRRRPRSPRPTPSARPSASATRPTAACPPATTSCSCASSGRPAAGRARAPTRARSASTRARPRRPTSRAGARTRPTRR